MFLFWQLTNKCGKRKEIKVHSYLTKKLTYLAMDIVHLQCNYLSGWMLHHICNLCRKLIQTRKRVVGTNCILFGK